MHKCKRLKEDEREFSHLLEWKLERERERRQMKVIKGLQQGIKAVNPSMNFLVLSEMIMADVGQICIVSIGTIHSFGTTWC